MPHGRIIANEQDCRSIQDVAHGRGGIFFASKRRSKSREVGSAVMIDVVGLHHYAGKLLKQIIFFVGGAIRTDYTNRLSAIFVANFFEPASHQFKCFFPRRRRQASVLANQRLGDAVFMIGEVESIAALDAEEISVDAALVAVIAANNFRAGIGAAYT